MPIPRSCRSGSAIELTRMEDSTDAVSAYQLAASSAPGALSRSSDINTDLPDDARHAGGPRLEAECRLLHDVPREEGHRGRDGHGDQEQFPPASTGTQVGDGLLHGPAVDVEAVGKVAEARGRDRGQARM